jgi:hypothetical protein
MGNVMERLERLNRGWKENIDLSEDILWWLMVNGSRSKSCPVTNYVIEDVEHFSFSTRQVTCII